MSNIFNQETLVNITEWLYLSPLTSWYITNDSLHRWLLGFEWLVGLLLVVAYGKTMKDWGFRDFWTCLGWEKWFSVVYLTILGVTTYCACA